MPPGRFLSDAEIERLEGWPETIERRDVVRFFAPAGKIWYLCVSSAARRISSLWRCSSERCGGWGSFPRIWQLHRRTRSRH